MASSVNKPAWWEWIETLTGGVSRQTYAATLPPDRYHCLLDDLPLHLIPQSARQATVRLSDPEAAQRSRQQALFLNSECSLLPAGEAPEQFRTRKDLLAGFAQQGSIGWVPDPMRGNLLPFWLSPRLESVLRKLKPGESASSEFDASTCELLERAGVLVPRDQSDANRAEARHREWEDIVRKASPGFREKGYAPLPALIHPFHVAALRRYYRHLIRTGKILLGDGQSSRRYVAYKEPVARFFHHALAPTLSLLAGEPLQPSYVYLASYLSGAELKKHTDREQCEFSITFSLDFSPEPLLETPWPLQLDSPDGTVSVYQVLGDGLAYRGTRLPHYRGVLPEGQTSTSIFFHYVSADFEGSLD
jgi:hypothetical protein